MCCTRSTTSAGPRRSKFSLDRPPMERLHGIPGVMARGSRFSIEGTKRPIGGFILEEDSKC
jgi:hypothetical protein